VSFAFGVPEHPRIGLTSDLAAVWPPAKQVRPRAAPATTGLRDLDRLRVFAPGRATVVTGPPGVGATSFALGIALHASSQTRSTVAYVTDHLDRAEIGDRLVAQHGRIDLVDLASKPPDGSEGHRARDAVSLDGLPLVLVEASDGVTPLELSQVADALESASKPLRLLIVDRVSALRPSNGCAGDARNLVATLLDLLDRSQVSVLLVERPAQVRESAARPPSITSPSVAVSALHCALPQRLQAVLWLHRADLKERHSDDAGLGEIHVLWHRHGATGYVRASYLHHRARWTDLSNSAVRLGPA
jgi:replicative DNA helicase